MDITKFLFYPGPEVDIVFPDDNGEKYPGGGDDS